MSSPLWTSQETTAAGIGASSTEWKASGVSIDSRSLVPGDMFIALKGPNFDGHAFVNKAFEMGAAVAMVSDTTIDYTGPVLQVSDTMIGLEALGKAARDRNQGKIIAITGSVGKTSSKEALRAVLSDQDITHASAASFNNHWGVPLSLARMPAECQFGIFELGMNNAGELGPLSKMVRPHIAMITNVEPVHLAAFNSVREIAEAKAEILEGLSPDGLAVLNADNKFYDLLCERAVERGLKIATFGRAETASARLIRSVVKDQCTCSAGEVDGHAVTFKVGAAGTHWAINGLAILLIVTRLGADLGRAALSLQNVHAVKGRGERHHIQFSGDQNLGGFLLIDESYNASPVAVRAALNVLGQQDLPKGGRRILVLGDMLELGSQSPALHAGLADDVINANVDLFFACGDMMAHLFDALPSEIRAVHTDSSVKLIEPLLDAIRPGDVVTVKGSLGSRMAPIVDALLELGETDAEPVRGKV